MKKWKKWFWVFGFPPILWMLVILTMSSIPGKHLPNSFWLHQFGHFVEYFIFGILFARGLAHLRIRLNIWQFVLLSVVLILVFASFDEWRQGWTPGRHARLDTVFFDGVYATLGILLYSQIVFAILVVKKHHLRLRRNANTAEVWSNEKL